MDIIEIHKFSQIKGAVQGYCAQPSVDAAIQDYRERHGEPSIVYYKKTASGRCTVYIGKSTQPEE